MRAASSVCNQSQLVGTQDGTMVVPCYDWATFLSGHYRRIPGLLSLHSFAVSDEVVDVMTMKEHTDSVSRKLTIGKGTIPAGLPPSITPAGLPLDRQRYLHSDIREFCRDGTADLVCPEPAGDGPSAAKRVRIDG